MVIIMGVYILSHGKFHDRGYSDTLYGINNIDIMMLYSRTLSNHNHLVITLLYCPDWVVLSTSSDRNVDIILSLQYEMFVE